MALRVRYSGLSVGLGTALTVVVFFAVLAARLAPVAGLCLVIAFLLVALVFRSALHRFPAESGDQLGHAKVSMTQDKYMSRGRVHTQVAELLDRTINDE